MMSKYRIIEYHHHGYKVQIFRWWWPFWIEADFVNTHYTIEDALEFAKHHATRKPIYLGKLS